MLVKVHMLSAASTQEADLLRRMKEGIEAQLIPADDADRVKLKRINRNEGLGLGVEFAYTPSYDKCDVAVMLGSWKYERGNTHHQVRTSIAEKAKCFICIETPILNRTVAFDQCEYFRVGVNGFLNKDAYFGPEKNHTNDRLKKHPIAFNGWNPPNTNNKVVVAMQLHGDASLRGTNINGWAYEVITQLLIRTHRPIEVRLHPALSGKGLVGHDDLLRLLAYSDVDYSRVKFVKGSEVSWKEQIADAHCVVAYTSGLSIDAILSGVPVIAYDEGNFAWNISDTTLDKVENIKRAPVTDVQQWLNNLAYCQWTAEEMGNGTVWNHLRPGIEECLLRLKQEEQ